jgi:ABC-type lipoprotein export system ATPase subunit
MINLKNIEMTYDDNGTKINALKIKNIEIKSGEKVAFVGPSGGGKTTICHSRFLITGRPVPPKKRQSQKEIEFCRS